MNDEFKKALMIWPAAALCLATACGPERPNFAYHSGGVDTATNVAVDAHHDIWVQRFGAISGSGPWKVSRTMGADDFAALQAAFDVLPPEGSTSCAADAGTASGDSLTRASLDAEVKWSVCFDSTGLPVEPFTAAATIFSTLR